MSLHPFHSFKQLTNSQEPENSDGERCTSRRQIRGKLHQRERSRLGRSYDTVADDIHRRQQHFALQLPLRNLSLCPVRRIVCHPDIYTCLRCALPAPIASSVTSFCTTIQRSRVRSESVVQIARLHQQTTSIGGAVESTGRAPASAGMGALLYFVILALVSLTGRAAAVSSARAFRLKGTVLLEAKKKSAIDAGEKVEPNEKAGHEDTQELPLFLIRRSLTRSIPPYAVPHDKEQMEPEAMSRIKRMNLRIVIPGKEDFQKADVAPSFNYYVKLRESPHTISSPRGLATKAFGVTGVNIKPNTWIEDEVRDRPRRILRVGLLKMENTAKP